MDERIIIEGIVENIIYHNEENGYCVFSVFVEINEEDDSQVVCVGFIPVINIGETIKVTGRIVTHPTYGEQLQIDNYEKTPPKTERGIEKYLSSGIVKGVGPKLAKRIVDKFGKESIDIITYNPERLAEIRGISEEKAMIIGSVFQENIELMRASLFLQQYGISTTYAVKIFKKYKEKTIQTVEKNPYALCDDIFGIGFKIADNIAFKMGIAGNSPYRIQAGVKYMLGQATNSGHIYLPEQLLVEKTAELLQISKELVQQNLMSLIIDNHIYVEKGEDFSNVYLNYFYYAESYIAKKLLDLYTVNEKNMDYSGEIKYLETIQGIKFAPNQIEAINSAMNKGLLVITGGPGTGKTTIINGIIALLEQEDNEITLAAPTGRAAKRMSEATMREAQTIHRLLGIKTISDGNQRQSFCHDEENPIDCDVLIIDEFSMVDVPLMHALMRAVPYNTKVIMVGDVNQLPSVGAGNVLKDIIKSEVVPVVELKDIFRQAQESAIVINAHKINNGEYPDLKDNSNDFFFMRRLNQQQLIDAMLISISEKLPNYGSFDPLKDIQVLTPMRKSPLGVLNLNKVLQDTLNPYDKIKQQIEYRGTVFRQGDKVMQIKNNYNTVWRIVRFGKVVEEGVGVFNGDLGLINYIDMENKYVEVIFDDDKVVHYEFNQLDELELSYAITIHKSQGSEYRVVIIPVHSGPDMLMTRNLLYTALTRAKEMAVIIGIPETVYRMVDNNKEINRYTSLAVRLRELKGI